MQDCSSQLSRRRVLIALHLIVVLSSSLILLNLSGSLLGLLSSLDLSLASVLLGGAIIFIDLGGSLLGLLGGGSLSLAVIVVGLASLALGTSGVGRSSGVVGVVLVRDLTVLPDKVPLGKSGLKVTGPGSIVSIEP